MLSRLKLFTENSSSILKGINDFRIVSSYRSCLVLSLLSSLMVFEKYTFMEKFPLVLNGVLGSHSAAGHLK